MPGIEIRPAQIEDSPAVAGILARLAAELGDGERFRSTADLIRLHGFGDKPLFRCHLAEAEGKFLGLALYFPVFSTTRGQPGVYVQDLWVDAKARGTGLGRKLLAVTASAASEDWGAAYLMLTVYDDNEGAVAFYHRLGFSNEERDRPLWIEGPGFQELRRLD
jgi:ribosomal protein S18 acetylase RimI-like enzyme